MPISILGHIIKLFENIVLKNILPSVNLTLIDEQYGFRSERSAVMNLLVLSNFTLEAFESKCLVDIIYLLTSKKPLIESITTFYFKYSASRFWWSAIDLVWIISIDRYQWVKINGCKSNVISIASEVPQGDHLKPLLFALFINGIK